MTEIKVELDRNVTITHTTWDGTFKDMLELEYIERSPDPWYGNNDVSIDIDKEQAIALIALLQRFVDRAL
jgi:hypothetical protein